MSAREVLRDLRLERGETPADDPRDELVEALRLCSDPDPLLRSLANEATDEAGDRACIEAWWRRRTGR